MPRPTPYSRRPELLLKANLPLFLEKWIWENVTMAHRRSYRPKIKIMRIYCGSNCNISRMLCSYFISDVTWTTELDSFLESIAQISSLLLWNRCQQKWETTHAQTLIFSFYFYVDGIVSSRCRLRNRPHNLCVWNSLFRTNERAQLRISNNPQATTDFFWLRRELPDLGLVGLT